MIKTLKTMGLIIGVILFILTITWLIVAGDLNFFGWSASDRVVFIFIELVGVMGSLIAAEDWGWV